MGSRVERNLRRFEKIVRDKIREDLRKYMSQGELIGRQGKDYISIPIPQIDIPRFRYGSKNTGGVGQGRGDVGDPIGRGDSDPGSGQAGDEPGEHILEVDVTFEELAQILGEELQLPNIEPKGGKKNIVGTRHRYNRIRTVGPQSLRHNKRTYIRALQRAISSGTYNPDDPTTIMPIPDDKRYRSWTDIPDPENNAVIILMMDISGSMGTQQKEIVRQTAFWIEVWLRSQYKKIEIVYIVHDVAAKEVDKETFYHLHEGGGTLISSAYRLCSALIDKRYPPSQWNIYPFHFSDGDNWGPADNPASCQILREEILPKVNLFCYGQVKSSSGTGKFLDDLTRHFGTSQKNLIFTEISDKENIYDAIKTFLGTGR